MNVQNCWIEGFFLLNIEVMASQEALILLECNKQKKRRHEAVHPPSLHIPPMSFEKRVGGPMWCKKRPPQMGGNIDTQWFFLNFIHVQQRCFCSLHGNKTTNVTTLRMKRLQLPQGPSTPAWNAWSLSPSRRAKSDRACCNATVSSWKQWK